MNLTETTSHIGERLSDVRAEVKGLGRTAGEKLDEARYWTAGEVHTAASSVRTAGQRGSEAIDGLTSTAADKLDSTAAYVRGHDAGGMFADLRQVMSRHPVGLFAMAAAIGFLAGAAILTKAQKHER